MLLTTLALGLALMAEFPDPVVDNKAATGKQTAVLAGGCFWCVEAVYQHIEGVEKVVISRQVVEGISPPLYTYADVPIRVGDADASA